MRHIYDFKKITSSSSPIRRRTKSNYGRKEKILLVIFILVVGGWVYTFYFSAIFKIQNVIINNLEKIDRANLEQLLNADGKNIFRFNIKKAKQAVLDAYFVDEVIIKKQYPKNLNITIKEKYPAFELHTPANNYLLDANGFVLNQESASGTTRLNASLPLIETTDEKVFAAREQAIETQKIEATKFFLTNLKTEDNLDILKINFTTTEPEVITMKTTTGFDVMVSYREDNQAQLFKLTAFLKAQGDKLKDLLYVNARFVDRVYYKFR